MTDAVRLSAIAAPQMLQRQPAVTSDPLVRAPAKPADIPKAYRDFEAFILQTFVQEMLPDKSQALFGKGIAGDSWRSMLAEKIARNVADAGGIGIAEQLAGARPSVGALPARKT